MSLSQHPDGVTTRPGTFVVYDVDRNEAGFGAVSTDGHALVWQLHEDLPPEDVLLSVEVDLDPSHSWLIRCDRVDFPPGGVAHLHTHPGPGIRCVLHGELTIEADGRTTTYGPFEPWFEAASDPVTATASASEETAFVRVMLLPRAWEGKRTIRYLDPADRHKPKTQRSHVFFDRRLDL